MKFIRYIAFGGRLIVTCLLMCVAIYAWLIHSMSITREESKGVTAYMERTVTEKLRNLKSGILISTTEKFTRVKPRILPKEEEASNANEDELDGDTQYFSLLNVGCTWMDAEKITDFVYTRMSHAYEKKLLMQFAAQNLTEKKIKERIELLDLSDNAQQAEAIALRNYGIVWHHVTRDRSVPIENIVRVGDGATGTVGIDLSEEEEDNLIQIVIMARVYGNMYRRSLTKEEKEMFKLPEAYRVFLNRLIIERKLDMTPVTLFCSNDPLTDADKAFINEIIKSNPAVKVPWSKE